jgi:protein-tyrosine phosphatase
MAAKEIFWIKGNPPAQLAVILRPQGGNWLPHEMLRLRRGGIKTVVSLLEPEEAGYLELAEEPTAAREAGMDFLSYPIPDVCVPVDEVGFRRFVAGLAERLRNGDSIGVHCRACIGRATVTTACTLIELGWKPKAALAAIAEARGYRVPDTPEQREWILNYRARL